MLSTFFAQCPSIREAVHTVDPVSRVLQRIIQYNVSSVQSSSAKPIMVRKVLFDYGTRKVFYICNIYIYIYLSIYIYIYIYISYFCSVGLYLGISFFLIVFLRIQFYIINFFIILHTTSRLLYKVFLRARDSQ